MPAATSSPIHPVVDQLAELIHELVLPTQLLVPALAGVADPRHRRGIRHRLPAILALSLCAVIAGARSSAAIAQWAADLPPHLLGGLGADNGVPSESTFRRTLQRINGDAMDIGGWAAKRAAGFYGLRAVAVDGKSVGGARTADNRCPHLLGAITHTDGVVLGQANVDAKTNEIPMLPILLDTIDLTRTIVTADAMHCQKTHAAYLVQRRCASLPADGERQPTRPTLTTGSVALDRHPDRSLRRCESPRPDRTTHP